MGFEENVYHIALVDDNSLFLTDLKDFLKQYINEQMWPASMDAYEKPKELLWKMHEGKKYDLYIMDIKMPDLNGIELAKKIRETDEWHPILFLTDYEDGAVAGYKVEACDYVMKRTYKREITKTLLKCHQAWERERDEFYHYYYDEEYRVLRCRDIRYVEVDARTRMLTIVTGDETLKERKSLAKFLEEINKDFFMIVSRGIAINLLHVTGAGEGKVILEGDVKVPLGKMYKASFFETIMKVYGEDTFGRL